MGGAIDSITAQERRGVNINTVRGIKSLRYANLAAVVWVIFFSQIVQGKKIRLLSWVQRREEGKKHLNGEQ